MDQLITLYRVIDPEVRRKEVYFATLEEAMAYQAQIEASMGKPIRPTDIVKPVSKIVIGDVGDLVDFLNNAYPDEMPKSVADALRKRRRVTGASADRLRERPF